MKSKPILKLLGGLACIIIAGLLSMVIWQLLLNNLYIDPDVIPSSNLVVCLAAFPALIIYLVWFLVLNSDKPPHDISKRKPVLWTIISLAATVVIQLVLSLIFGLAGEMVVSMIISSLLIAGASALGFFALRPW